MTGPLEQRKTGRMVIARHYIRQLEGKLGTRYIQPGMKQKGRSLSMSCNVKTRGFMCFGLQDSVPGKVAIVWEKSIFTWMMVHIQLVTLQRKETGSTL